jgi:mono/diheme cytochrome c family protein
MKRLPIAPVVFAALIVLLAPYGAAMGQNAPPTASADLVKRGEYLARAGDCTSCHTKPGGTPYAGGLRIKTPFGDILTPNITPDPATGIGSWTANDFYTVLHDGVSKRVGDLYPAMPYTFYTKVTREDSDAIFAYLRSLPPVNNAVDVNQLRWPFDIRWSMLAWRELYFTEGTYKPDPAWGPEWNRGAYLVEGLGHCSACHSPRNWMGAIEKDKAFTGASIDGWFALNLTENWRTGLGQWNIDQIVSFLKKGAAKGKSTSLGDMHEVVHNSLSYLSDADLRAMATYLKTLPAKSSSVATGPVEPVGKPAAKLYIDHCAGCHQAKGRGIPGIFPPLAGNGAVVAPDPANILKVVLGGIPARGGYIPMPSFASQLSDAQIADIANYVRSNWGNAAPTNATPQTVAALRRTLPDTAGPPTK